MFVGKYLNEASFQVLHSRLRAWPYPQTLDSNLLRTFVNYRRKKFNNIAARCPCTPPSLFTTSMEMDVQRFWPSTVAMNFRTQVKPWIPLPKFFFKLFLKTQKHPSKYLPLRLVYSTADLLIKSGCFVKKEKYSFSMKSSWSELKYKVNGTDSFHSVMFPCSLLHTHINTLSLFLPKES